MTLNFIFLLFQIVNAECKVLDTLPVRTMICVCIEGYQGNAAVQCDKGKCSHTQYYQAHEDELIF